MIQHFIIFTSILYTFSGFLSTKTAEIPGNAGALDVLFALKWVKRNIKYFGGNPNKITVMGQSSGAAMMIIHSGSVFAPWTHALDPVAYAKDIAYRAKVPKNSSLQEINDAFMKMDVYDLIKAANQHFNNGRIKGSNRVGSRSLTVGGPSFYLPFSPEKLLRMGYYKKNITLLIGVVQNEGSFLTATLYDKLKALNVLNSPWFMRNLFLPIAVNILGVEDSRKLKLSNLVEKIFGAQIVNNAVSFLDYANGFSELAGTIGFKEPVLQLAQVNTMFNPYQTFLYSFDYHGAYSRFGYEKDVSRYPFDGGVSHSDDLIYLFPYPEKVAHLNPTDTEMARNVVALWISFVETDIPRLKLNSTFQWPAMTNAITRPDIDRMQPPLASSSMTTIPTTMTQRANITMDTVTRSQWLISSLSASTERPSNLSASTKGTSSVSSKPIISSPPSIALPLTAPSSSEPLGKPNLQNDFDIGPYLDDTRITNITVQVGTNAYLPCKVKQLGNKSVSWVRVRDDHILSVDRITFIADERFQAYFKEELKQWVLQIKYVQPRDVGLYECQVSTEPKVSARAYLHVVVPRTELIGDSDRYVKTGSTVHLQCIIYGAIEPPTYIMWYHDTQPIHADNKLGYKMHLIKSNVLRNNDGVKFELNDLVQSPLDDAIQRQNSVGSLLIESTRKYHSGNYSCNPSNSAPSTVTLHVISSESSASAVKSSASQKRLISLFFYTLCIIEMLLTITQRQT